MGDDESQKRHHRVLSSDAEEDSKRLSERASQLLWIEDDAERQHRGGKEPEKTIRENEERGRIEVCDQSPEKGQRGELSGKEPEYAHENGKVERRLCVPLRPFVLSRERVEEGH